MTTKYYEDAWFKVEYDIQEVTVYFKAYKISGLDTDNLENSDTEEEPNIEGSIKWDGCMNFNQSDHYCGVEHAEQTLLVVKEIYKFKESLGGSFAE